MKIPKIWMTDLYREKEWSTGDRVIISDHETEQEKRGVVLKIYPTYYLVRTLQGFNISINKADIATGQCWMRREY